MELTFTAYQEAAARTAQTAWPNEKRVAVDCYGLVAEVGELLDEFQHRFEHERPLDLAQVQEELGDMLWRMADLCSALDIRLGDIAQANIAKLQIRHPNGFSATTSKLRQDKAQDAAA